MDKFEYLATLVSVVAGLAMARALSGLARAVEERGASRISGVQLAWTGSVLLWLVTYWWFTFYLSAVDPWTVSLFLFVLLYGAIIYFLIALLYPENFPTGNDTFEHFVENRRWFFGTFLLLGFIDLVDTLVKVGLYNMHPPWIRYSILMGFWVVLGTVGFLTRNHAYHKAFAYGWVLVSAVWATTLFRA